MATFLQLINKVLVALREDTTLGISEPYTRLIAQFVNDAKEEVEDAGPWKALRTEVSFAATISTDTTTLTTTNHRSYIYVDPERGAMLFRTDADNEGQITVVPIEALRAARLSSDTDPNEPNLVAFTTDGTNLVAHFWPTPDATYNYKAIMVVPQDELTEETDVLSVPERPVVRKAIFYAMDERGSEFSGRLETEARKAEIALSNAMLTDFGSDVMTVTEA